MMQTKTSAFSSLFASPHVDYILQQIKWANFSNYEDIPIIRHNNSFKNFKYKKSSFLICFKLQIKVGHCHYDFIVYFKILHGLKQLFIFLLRASRKSS